MNYKITLLPLFLLLFHLGAVAQNSKEVLALKEIKTPSFVLSFEYDIYGRVITEIRESKDEYLTYKFEYEYDAKGNLVQQIEYRLYHTQKEDNIYNDNNQIIEKKIYLDYGTGFKYLEQYFYTYDENLLVTLIQQIISNGQGVNCIKREFYYNAEQKPVQIIQSSWAAENWIHTETFDYEYNEFGDLLAYSCESSMDDIFYKSWKYNFLYNDTRELIERTYYFGAGTEWSSQPTTKYQYEYEPVKEGEALCFPNIYNFDDIHLNWFHSDNKLVSDNYWLADCSSILHFVESSQYSYNLITIITDDEQEEEEEGIVDEYIDILVYPNPTTGELRITNYELEIKNVEIFDVYGKKQFLSTCSPVHSSTINISHLPSGIYFVKIVTENQIITKKIMKQ
jgi:hypothetical protein